MEFQICYMILQLYIVYPHLSANLDCEMILLILFLLCQQVDLTLLDQLALYIQMIHSLKCCMLQFCYIAVTFFIYVFRY